MFPVGGKKGKVRKMVCFISILEVMCRVKEITLCRMGYVKFYRFWKSGVLKSFLM